MSPTRRSLIVALALWVALVVAVALGGRSEPEPASARTDTAPEVSLVAQDLGSRLDATIAVLSVPTTTTVPPTTTTTAPPPPTTVAPPPPVAAPAPSGGCSGWADLVAAYFPPAQVATACRVMACESGGNPGVHNEAGSGASGLFQFMPGTWTSTTGLAPPASAYSPDVQIRAAAALWASSGWGPWGCY